MKRGMTHGPAYLVMIEDFDADYHVFKDLEDAGEFFRGCVQDEFDRRGCNTDDNGRSLEECAEDWIAYFGSTSIYIMNCRLWGCDYGKRKD